MAFLTLWWILDATIFLSIMFLAVYLYVTRNFRYWKQKGIEEIPPKPFFGNFGKYFTLQISPGNLFKSFYEQSEGLPYVGIYSLDKPCLLLRDPEIIKTVLIKDFNAFSDKFMHSSDNDNLSNRSLFFIGNPEWKFLRSKLSSLFTSCKLKIMFANWKDVTKDLEDYMDSLGLEGAGKEVNVKEICAKFTTDLIGLTAFGSKFNCLTDPNAEFRKLGREMSGANSWRRNLKYTSICLMPHITTFFDFRFFDKPVVKFFKNAFQNILEERKGLKIDRNDLIDLLIQLKNGDENINEENCFKLENDDLLAQAMIFFVAGYDTSATTMYFTLYELAKNQDIQKKLRSEMMDSITSNDGKITFDMITNLQYLDMVISETLRLYPTVPVLDRKATKDYKFEETGLIIEKGTPILIPVLGFHYDPKYFDNPNSYNPENFSEYNKSSRNPYVYMPFGIGPRSCIGLRQGLLQSKLGIAHIISKYEVSLSEDTSPEIDPKGFFTVTKKDMVLNIRKLGTETVPKVIPWDSDLNLGSY